MTSRDLGEGRRGFAQALLLQGLVLRRPQTQTLRELTERLATGAAAVAAMD